MQSTEQRVDMVGVPFFLNDRLAAEWRVDSVHPRALGERPVEEAAALIQAGDGVDEGDGSGHGDGGSTGCRVSFEGRTAGLLIGWT